MSHADIHFHLLHGVDDGPETLADSVALARAAVADGTRTVVCTPHVRTDFVTEPLDVVELVRELREALAHAGVPLELRCGGELGHDLAGTLSQPQLEAIAQGPAGNRWLLVEAPFDGLTGDFRAATAELRERGFGVVIAHPERVAFAETDGLEALRLELAQGSRGAAERPVSPRRARRRRPQRRAQVRRAGSGRARRLRRAWAAPPALLGAACSALLDAGVSPGRAWSLTRAQPARLLAEGLPAPLALAA